MTTHRIDDHLILACSLVGGLLGCEVGIEASEDMTESPRNAVTLQDAACRDDRQIVWDATGQCTTNSSDWQGHRLFTHASGDLVHYCQFDYVGDPNSTPDPTVLTVNDDLRGPDCEVVFAESQDPQSVAIAPFMQAIFHDAIGHVTPAELNLDATEGGRTDVVVAVIDTMPEGAMSPRSTHGNAMARLVLDVACPNPQAPTCHVDVDRVLGMPRYQNGGVDTVNGGFYGSQADLAVALHDVVRQTPTGTNLIISLSLGWEGQFFGSEEDPTVGVDAIHDVLKLANCKGFLVLAAAGNDSHLCTSEPLYPASWEQEAAPNTQTCSDLGEPSPVTRGNGYAPLLYSVGGLDYDGEPMPAARDLGMPRLAGVGMHAMPDLNSPRSALNGTSVPTALTAGTAALLWSYFGSLPANDIMQSIYDGGPALTFSADYSGPGAASTTVHALDVCEAFDAAWNRQDTPFPNVNLDCGASATATFADVATAVDNLVNVSAPTVTFTGSQANCAVGCDAPGTIHYTSAVASSPCPQPTAPERPYTTPQPDSPVCPSCTIDPGTGLVTATLDDDYPYTPTDVLVTTYDDGTPSYYRLGALALSHSQATEFYLDPLGGLIVDEAKITVSFDVPGVAETLTDDLIILD